MTDEIPGNDPHDTMLDKKAHSHITIYDDSDETLAAAIKAQLKAAPWYLGSAVIHALIFFVLLIAVPPSSDKVHKPTIVLRPRPEMPEIPQFEEPPPPEEVEPTETDIDPNDMLTEMPDIPANITVDLTTDSAVVDIAFDEISTGDEESEAIIDTVAVIGLGDVGAINTTSFGATDGRTGSNTFGFRRAGGGKSKAIKGGGGNDLTVQAVNAGLAWLSRNQEPEGFWYVNAPQKDKDTDLYPSGWEPTANPRRIPRRDPHWASGLPRMRSTTTMRYDANWEKNQVAITSLAALAFLGDGNTTRVGMYKSNVSKAINWLIAQQETNGIIGEHKYQAAMAMLVLAEAYGMSSDPRLKAAAQKAVNWATSTQNDIGAWSYFPGDQEAADIAVTSWWIIGLKNATVANLDVPKSALEKAKNFITYSTSADGTALFQIANQKGQRLTLADLRTSNRSSGRSTVQQGSYVMSAIALSSLQFLGVPRSDPKVKAAAGRLVFGNKINDPNLDKSNPDNVDKRNMPHTNLRNFQLYHWYYVAMGLYQYGPETPEWKFFVKDMVEALVKLQFRQPIPVLDSNEVTTGQNWDVVGAWPLPDHNAGWNNNAEGRDFNPYTWGVVGQTAVGVLTLEVFYRYYR